MARRPLLTGEERQLLFGVPDEPDALARHYTFTRSDQDLVVGRRSAANRLGFAVQLALLRHPGMGLAQMEEPVDALVEWLAAQLEIPAAAFADYAGRP
jgi:TnpA family transposase